MKDWPASPFGMVGKLRSRSASGGLHSHSLPRAASAMQSDQVAQAFTPFSESTLITFLSSKWVQMASRMRCILSFQGLSWSSLAPPSCPFWRHGWHLMSRMKTFLHFLSLLRHLSWSPRPLKDDHKWFHIVSARPLCTHGYILSRPRDLWMSSLLRHSLRLYL